MHLTRFLLLLRVRRRRPGGRGRAKLPATVDRGDQRWNAGLIIYTYYDLAEGAFSQLILELVALFL